MLKKKQAVVHDECALGYDHAMVVQTVSTRSYVTSYVHVQYVPTRSITRPFLVFM
jgi:hypothetical protein